jgi:hypothetical protein
MRRDRSSLAEFNTCISQQGSDTFHAAPCSLGPSRGSKGCRLLEKDKCLRRALSRIPIAFLHPNHFAQRGSISFDSKRLNPATLMTEEVVVEDHQHLL